MSTAAPAKAADDRAVPAEPVTDEAQTLLHDIDQMLLEVAGRILRLNELVTLE